MPPKDKYKGPDPDPSPYLYVSIEAKEESANRTYDAKKSCWLPCSKEGFVVGDIRGVKGDQITVFGGTKVGNCLKHTYRV